MGVVLALAMTIVAGVATSSVLVRREAFCGPAAHVAALLSGAPCVKDGVEYRLIGSDLDLTVAPACAAVDYFCLLAGVLSLLMTRRGVRWGLQLLVLPLAWALTIFINALRLTACWQTDRLVQPWLPPALWPAPHMAVGIATFLVGLILVFWVMTRNTTTAGKDEHHE